MEPENQEMQAENLWKEQAAVTTAETDTDSAYAHCFINSYVVSNENVCLKLAPRHIVEVELGTKTRRSCQNYSYLKFWSDVWGLYCMNYVNKVFTGKTV